MKIVKVYNNNVVQALDSQGREIIVMGKGLGFQKKVDQCLDQDKIEKTFVLQGDTAETDLFHLYSQMPAEEVDLVTKLISKAEVVLGTSYELSLYLSLGDHLHYALERSRKGLSLENPLAWEVRKFYPQEYQLGLETIEEIRDKFGIQMEQSEASSLALHLINAKKDKADSQQENQVHRMVHQILDIVRLHLGWANFTEDTSFHRFVTHLRYFAQRVLQGQVEGREDAFLYQQVQVNYPQAFAVSEKIKTFVKESYGFDMSLDEQVYLTIHIQRLIK
ncbi:MULTISPECIES: BglG family transcription antiterminator LicT [unclassified Streptococcus]|uniref:BglG family transcription antiterminator LicT n=1 Tax=unclassified Streptococcus TaxID=2608887 RepID=UPI00107190E7|nr:MULTISPECIES: PRD domain-containing protein [unclassified Streptococcus]MBF0806690.1 PRD domain-containing protein [Streptococcus sp. 19428wA2_WM07]TFU26573.1 PRD domain-containing protein [Streptococcus sp. WM07]